MSEGKRRLWVVPQPDDGGSLPPYGTHGGHTVSWQPWEQVGSVSHVPWTCLACEMVVRPWLSWGVVALSEIERRARRRRWRPGRPPEGGVIRLVAYRCPHCRDTRLWEMSSPDGARPWREINPGRPTLF